MAPEVTSLPVATEHQVSGWAGVYVCPEPASVSQTPKTICPKSPLWASRGVGPWQTHQKLLGASTSQPPSGRGARGPSGCLVC